MNLSPVANRAAQASRRKRWGLGRQAAAIRVVAVVLAAWACTTFVPSSGRASEFVKIGSPIPDTADFYAIATVYDRNPKQYEAWAVGNASGAGLIAYYNGNFWSRVSIPSVPPLRSISAIRYIRTQNSSGGKITPIWSTSAWAVGDGGTVLRLDPYSNQWRLLRKQTANIHRCANQYGATCVGPGDLGCGLNSQGVQIACTNVKDLACTDADIAAPGSTCANWTPQDLKAVAAKSEKEALIGGLSQTFMQSTESYVSNFATNTLTNINPSPIDPNDDITGISFIDNEHGWAVGYDRTGTNTGRLYKYTNRDGWTEVSISGVENYDTMRYTSVTAMLRKFAIAPNTPLTSVVWIGAEKTGACGALCGRIIRYDEANGFTVGTNAVDPVRSIALTRRASGQDIELATNGDFSADRQDNSGTNSTRFPDGWNGIATYTSGLGHSITSTALLNGGTAGKLFRLSPGSSALIRPMSWQRPGTRLTPPLLPRIRIIRTYRFLNAAAHLIPVFRKLI